MQYPLSLKADNKLAISVGILLLFHFCGLVGFHTPYRDWFLSNTPLNLVLATSLLLWNHREFRLGILLAFVAVFAAGFSVEVVGVKTGWVFGSYRYGDAFGPKLLGVPFMIGINWAALCLASSTVVSGYFGSLGLKAAAAAAAPVSIDFLIERVCESLDFWYWRDGQVPLQNYLAWYVCSFLFSLLLLPMLRGTRNPFAPYFLLVQFIFFLILNITYS